MSAQQKQISRKYQRICKMGADGLRHSRKKRNRYGQDKQRQKGKDTIQQTISPFPHPAAKNQKRNSGGPDKECGEKQRQFRLIPVFVNIQTPPAFPESLFLSIFSLKNCTINGNGIQGAAENGVYFHMCRFRWEDAGHAGIVRILRTLQPGNRQKLPFDRCAETGLLQGWYP